MHGHLSDYECQQEVSPENFAHKIDWLLKWRERDKTMEFSLVLIAFQEPSALGNALGAAGAMNLIRRVGREVSSVLRNTDLLCRTRVSSFWVLLPQGAPSIVLNKMEPILDAARADGLDATHLHIGKLSIPEDLNGSTSAEELFVRLRGGKK
jgi:GGDEF domain-containing protein